MIKEAVNLIFIKRSLKKFLVKFKKFAKNAMGFEIFHELSNKYRYSIKYRFRKFFYYGKDYYCPCCERYIRKFAPFGDPIRLNAECPFCYVMERHRLRFLYLKKKTNFFKENLKVLDFGPEYYMQKIFMKMNNLDYISADINPKNAMLQMNITNIEFNENSFDFIFCISVIEHVVNDKKALSELFRVLKPGGCAFIEVPINYDLKETVELLTEQEKLHHDKDFHVRDYAPDFFDHLKVMDFEETSISYKKELLPKKVTLYGLMNCEDTLRLYYKPTEQDIKKNSRFKVFKS